MIWQILLEDDNSSALAYMKVASDVLGGTSVTNAVADAENYTLETYSGAQACNGDGNGNNNGGGGEEYCGHAAYQASESYPTAGTVVYSDCQLWSSKWWANPGEAPGENAVWEAVEVCVEGEGCGATGIFDEFGASAQPVAIYNTQGKLVWRGNDISIDANDLPTGLYVVLLSDGNVIKQVLNK